MLLIERKIAKSFDLDLILDNSISLRLRKMQFLALCFLYFSLFLY
jgi:hypothetical protein